jgi:Bifunctional DNA primase/polymerase, N-terminal
MINEQTQLKTAETKLLLPSKSITEIALSYVNNGFSVIPTTANKQPDLKSWKHLQTNRPQINEIISWWQNDTGFIGIICGQVSGNLEVIDFDEKYNISPASLLTCPPKSDPFLT